MNCRDKVIELQVSSADERARVNTDTDAAQKARKGSLSAATENAKDRFPRQTSTARKPKKCSM